MLEAIIAIAILSMGVVSVLQAISFSGRVTGFSCDIINAVFLAEDKIQELEFKEKQNLMDKEQGQVKDKKDKFAREYTIALEPALNLYKLDLAIIWQRANKQQELKIATYLRP